MSTCVNCQSETLGKYCPNCGQRASVKRISFKEAWYDFWSRIYGFDGMFPRSIRDLTLNPGKVAREYLNGNRVKYYGPIGYFFFIITLYILVYSTFSIDMDAFMKSMVGSFGSNQSDNQAQMNSSIMHWVNDNQRLVSFLFIPFYMFWAWLLFRKQKLNWLEHGVLIFYSQGHMQWLSILSLATFSFFSFAPGFYWVLLISMIYYAYGCTQLYDNYSWVSAFMRGIMVNVLFFISFMITLFIIGVLYVILNPEVIEMIKPSNTGK